MRTSRDLRDALRCALRVIPEKESGIILDALEPFFLGLEQGEHEQFLNNSRLEALDQFVNASDLTDDEKKHIRIISRYTHTASIDIRLYAKLLDEAISKLDDAQNWIIESLEY